MPAVKLETYPIAQNYINVKRIEGGTKDWYLLTQESANYPWVITNDKDNKEIRVSSYEIAIELLKSNIKEIFSNV